MDLCEQRASEAPKLPKILQNIDQVRLEGQKSTTCISHQEEIEKQFPTLFGAPILKGSTGDSIERKPLKVGVVLSGGQAAGGHNVIAGLFDSLPKGSKLFGFLGGPGGIVDGHYKELTSQFIASYRNQGGFDMIGSGRTKIESEEQLKKSKETIESLKLEALVVIGGDDSNTNAAVLAEYLGSQVNVVGVPKTIDGDLQNPYVQISFGFDTATKTYSEMIGNIARDAISAKKYYHFVKLMGRSASHIALECALRTQPNYTFISEEIEHSGKALSELIKELAEMIEKRAREGKNYGVVLIPEGLIEFIPELKSLILELNRGELSKEGEKVLHALPSAIQEQLQMDRDPHGNVQVSHIQTEKLILELVKKELTIENFSPVEHFFGYEGRCGLPSHFDANYCYALGSCAGVILSHGKTGYMACVTDIHQPIEKWGVAALPITSLLCVEERKGKMKPVIQKALVDLNGAPFKSFSSKRESWKYADDYRFPGPIQFYGPDLITESIPLIVK
ncbi:MAG: diphosphate--fructose-6-phosphate 1-phosphotransferase [Simkaniaceae bacterium]|nr:diphosphate--fructose-6-phosphate 1-phosphotransferase [Simkaniaceae bacterium]